MIHWNIDPEIFSIGFLHIRWYGLLFALSFIIGLQIMTKIFKGEKKNLDDLNDLIWYMLLGTILGARLGHCLFYSPEYYLSNPLEIFFIWHGGLASHGAAIGILIAVYYFDKKKKYGYFHILDRIVITVALAGFFIRLGNFFNSEIIGKPTGGDWGVIFDRVDQIPRHPTQLYESFAYLSIFIILLILFKKFGKQFKDGFIFGLFLVLVFLFRIFVEYFKENQSAFENGMALNMGQILSIPLVLFGIYMLINRRKA